MLMILVHEQWDDSQLVKLMSAEPDEFAYAIAQLKRLVGAHRRSYKPELKHWRIGAPGKYEFARWLRLMESELDARVEYVTEEQEREPSRRQPALIGDHYTALHLLPTAPPSVVKAAYRELSKLYHPDRGGDGEQMQRINQAYEQIERQLTKAA